jgi:Holliday junction DNA helicase RuvA
MIGRLTGQPEVISEERMILDVNGVGYDILAPPQVIAEARKEDQLVIRTYLAVSDDALDLYGFTSDRQQSLFEHLLGVSGVGPKSALGILSVADAPTITSAIAAEDTSYLTKVSGIGTKTAEKVVLELKDTFEDTGTASDAKLREESGEAVEALQALGYSKSQAREAVGKIDKDINTTEKKVKHALKQLGEHE